MTKQKEPLAVRCPTCGAKPGEKCELSTGLPRTNPHRDRRFSGLGKVVLGSTACPGEALPLRS